MNSSVNVPMPGWLEKISSSLKFDPSGVLKCLIQTFEYTFYHNVLLMAIISATTLLLANGCA